jgi:hypothetical protein
MAQEIQLKFTRESVLKPSPPTVAAEDQGFKSSNDYREQQRLDHHLSI